MPRRRKISVQVILSLGIIGSAAGLVRMGYYHAYDADKYPFESLCKHSLHPADLVIRCNMLTIQCSLIDNWGHTILWSILEAGIGIITCSLPPLRRLFKKFYQGSSAMSGKRSRLGTIDVRNSQLDPSR